VKQRLFGFALVGIALCAMVVVTQEPMAAQLANDGKAKAKAGGGKGKGKGGPPPAPAKRITTVEINQPDFGGAGVWDVPYITNMGTPNSVVDGKFKMVDGEKVCEEFKNGAGGTTPSCAPFNEKGHFAFTRRRETDSATDPEGFCLPPGVPRMMYTPYPAKVIQEPKMLTFIYEGGAHVWRQIPIIAKKEDLKHTKDPNPTYLGESFGWWEGDTFVVDTIGFNTRTWLDFAGHPHGEKLHVVERYTRLNEAQIELLSTIEDPEFYTAPWTVRTNIPYNNNKQMMEYICQENEADTKHLLDDLRKRGIDPDKIP
jgi:hypothetical protein